MKHKISVSILATIAMAVSAAAQVSSHSPTGVGAQPAQSAPMNFSAANAAAMVTPIQVSDKPVARVNGTVLTDRDLLREMYAIFPYARQHNGFPKGQEATIRQGALEMIIFEELVYQEAGRRKLAVPPEKLNTALAEFRKQFSSPDQYDQYLKAEMHGSEQQLRQQVRRSLLIEQVLQSEVEVKSTVTPAEVRAYY